MIGLDGKLRGIFASASTKFASSLPHGAVSMVDPRGQKQLIRDLTEVVWVGRDLEALDRFWAADCVNHAAPGRDGLGLAEIRAYHEQFFGAFAALSDVRIEVVQQVSEGDRVVTQVATQARHTGLFFDVPATGRTVKLASIRIDRIHDCKIAEHWSVADMAGLMQQLRVERSRDRRAHRSGRLDEVEIKFRRELGQDHAAPLAALWALFSTRFPGEERPRPVAEPVFDQVAGQAAATGGGLGLRGCYHRFIIHAARWSVLGKFWPELCRKCARVRRRVDLLRGKSAGSCFHGLRTMRVHQTLSRPRRLTRPNRREHHARPFGPIVVR